MTIRRFTNPTIGDNPTLLSLLLHPNGRYLTIHFNLNTLTYDNFHFHITLLLNTNLRIHDLNLYLYGSLLNFNFHLDTRDTNDNVNIFIYYRRQYGMFVDHDLHHFGRLIRLRYDLHGKAYIFGVSLPFLRLNERNDIFYPRPILTLLRHRGSLSWFNTTRIPRFAI